MRRSVGASALRTIGRREPGPEVVADVGRGMAHRVAGEMRVPRGRGHHPVAEQVADHRQALAEREGAGGERLSEVVTCNPEAGRCRHSGAFVSLQ